MKEHVSEELLNMYLDGELTRRQQAQIEAHIQECEACRSEMRAMKNLFESLEAIRHAPIPDVWPQVEIRLSGGRLRRHRIWFGLALQGVVALGIMFWGLDHLVALGTRVTQAFDLSSLNLRFDLAGWWAEIWGALIGWPEAIRGHLHAWPGGLPWLDGRGVSMQQGILLVIVLATAWLVGNLLLLRHPYRKEASR